MRLLFLSFVLVLIILETNAQNCQLEVKVTGITDIKGHLIIALFDNEDDFLKDPVTSITLQVKNQTMSTCFSDVPEGIYSISVIHDLDKNGKLNTRIYGPPSEPYGFHNNEKGFMGPPSFEETSLEIKNGEKKVSEIQL